MNLDLAKIRAAVDIVRPVAAKASPAEWDDFEKLLAARCNDSLRPEIIFYGMYSHGKSTMINALLGRREAEIGRAPTTNTVDEYIWEQADCLLLDTPGIQAQKPDTLKADETLRKAALVALVVESGSIEEEVVWRTAARMLAQRQKICVLVNDFDMCRNDPKIYVPLLDKLRRLLQEAARAENFGGDIVAATPVILVDADMAMRGKLENKMGLVEASGIREVESELARLAAGLDMRDVAAMLGRNLLDIIAISKSRLAANYDNGILADAMDQLQALKMERDTAFREILDRFESELSMRRQFIEGIFASGSDSGRIQAELAKMTEDLIRGMEGFMAEKLGNAADKMRDICLNADRWRQGQFAGLEQHDNPQAADILAMLAGLKWNTLTNKINWEPMVKKAIVESLKKLKEWLPGLFRGKGSVIFGKWAASASRFLGYAAIVAPMIFDVYQGYKMEQEARDAAIRKAQAIHDAVESTMAAMTTAFEGMLTEIMASTFGDLIHKLEVDIQDLKRKNTLADRDLEILELGENLLAGGAA